MNQNEYDDAWNNPQTPGTILFQAVKTYEFDGTPEGFKEMVNRMFYESNDSNTFNVVTQEAHLQNGLIMRKGDHYVQVIRQKEWGAIGK